MGAALRNQTQVLMEMSSKQQSRDKGEKEHLGKALVSVIITCYNQAHFLGEAITSVLVQSYPHFEVVVVDDGSTDHTSEVVARNSRVRYVRQTNQGLSAARNAGLRRTQGDYVVFLDADDRLLPGALEVGVECLEAHLECLFVSGRYRNIASDGSIHRNQPPPLTIGADPYATLLQGNYIGMHATVMYRRAAFGFVGDFDVSLIACEDYDLYLRIAKDFPTYHHGATVAEYRHHGANMTRNSSLMLKTATAVLRAQRQYVKHNTVYKEAYKTGMKFWTEYYGKLQARDVIGCVREREWKQAFWGLLVLVRYYPQAIIHAWWKLQLPTRLRRWLPSKRTIRYRTPPVGRVDFGHLRRLTPVSRQFGFDRGQPIDRYYIENFLGSQAKDIKGRVLEIKDNTYSRRYGGSRVEVSDVLDIVEDNPQATVVADLSHAPHVPTDTFDCILCTQTLHLIYDMRSAISTLHRILKPGGVLLVTVPGISQIEHGASQWHWAFTSQSVEFLFEEAFPAANLWIRSHGNVLAATSFLQGLAAQELTHEELDYRDPCYEVLITLRAIKPEVPSL
jgi:glycosyltransferase involved in cell wall biosynthesis